MAGILRQVVGGLILVVGLFTVLALMGLLYRAGIFGTVFGFIVVLPLATAIFYMPGVKMINDGRRRRLSRG